MWPISRRVAFNQKHFHAAKRRKPFTNTLQTLTRGERVHLMISRAGCHTCTVEQWNTKVQNDEVSGKTYPAERKDESTEPRLSVSYIEGAEMFHSVSGALHSKQPMKGGGGIPYALDIHTQDLLAKFLQQTADLKEAQKKSPPPLFVYSCVFYGCVCVHVKAVHANKKTVAFQMELLDKFPVEGGQKDPKRRIIPFLPGKS